ncbi:MAG: WXG100 family type VII secretion target [Micrococcales bacterium]
MTQFQVDSDQVHAANAAIQNSIQQINTEIGALQVQLVALNDTWRGAAASEFQSLAVRWGTTASGVQRQLGELGTALALAASQYEEIEAANIRLFA